MIRRGPSSWFHVALWRYEEGVVEHGAWTKIKLYPERCGLSPDGRLLAVFALGGEWGAYFAVSRAPWLHALAAWHSLGTWTTGADISHDGTLTLAGCAGDEAFHGIYPHAVACLPVDTHWVRGRLFRELRTGWDLAALRHRGETIVDPPTWLSLLSAPLESHSDSVVITRTDPRSGRRLALVSLHENQREYHHVDGAHSTTLNDVASAEWTDDGNLLIATRSGRLRILDHGLEPLWEYDMDLLRPLPAPAPEWATRW